MKLSNIPDTFGFEEVQKGYFPHLLNRKEIQWYVGSYPSAQFYGHDYMTAKERVKYLKWHIEKRDETFDFQKEMLAYCRSEVDILRRGCERFHDVMMEAERRGRHRSIRLRDHSWGVYGNLQVTLPGRKI
jgi:hypothetical protein